jgi:hypothetical protein
MNKWLIVLSCVVTSLARLYVQHSFSKTEYALVVALITQCVLTLRGTWWVLLAMKLFVVGAWDTYALPTRVVLSAICLMRARTLHAIIVHTDPDFTTHRGDVVRDTVRSDLCCAYVRSYIVWEILSVLVSAGLWGVPLTIALYVGRDPAAGIRVEDIADYEARQWRSCHVRARWMPTRCC